MYWKQDSPEEKVLSHDGQQGSRAQYLVMGSLAWGPLWSLPMWAFQLCSREQRKWWVSFHSETKFRNLGNSSRWNHHYLPSLSIMLLVILNETAKILYFYRKDRHLLVISKLWSHCSYFAYQVLFQCQDLFCFTLSSRLWFKSCSWH